MQEAGKLIQSLNISDEYIILACSYGPDSMVLLNLLESMQLKIVVAHVNHKIRKEADLEYQLLEQYCTEKQIIFEGMEIDKMPHGNMENKAREIRYDFFEKIINKYQAKYLFTAHHGDDLIETILMRLIRGAAFKGYAGFNKITKYNNYLVIRPLIYYTKDEILVYAKDKDIRYAIDHTNNEDMQTRNRLRHHVLPALKKEHQNVHQKFLRFNEIINEYEEYFNKKTKTIYNKLYVNDRLDLNEFLLIDIIFQKRVINEILLNIYGNDINRITDDHLLLVMNLINSHRNSYVVLPNRIKVAKFYNMIVFNYHENSKTSYDYVLRYEVTLPSGKIIKLDQTDTLKSNYLIRLNSTEISLPLHVRSRKNGDRMQVKNLGGTKKVNDILIDSKIPNSNRKTYPLLVDNNDQILWIPGIKKSKFDKQKDESYDIILQYIQKGEKDEKQE